MIGLLGGVGRLAADPGSVCGWCVSSRSTTPTSRIWTSAMFADHLRAGHRRQPAGRACCRRCARQPASTPGAAAEDACDRSIAMQIQPILAALRRHRLATHADRAGDRAGLRGAVQRLLPDRQPPRSDPASTAASTRTRWRVCKLTGYRRRRRRRDLNARVLSRLARDSRRAVGQRRSTRCRSASRARHRRHHHWMPAGKHFGGVVDFYLGGPGSFEALGLHLVAGRAPQAGRLPAGQQLRAGTTHRCW